MVSPVLEDLVQEELKKAAIKSAKRMSESDKLSAEDIARYTGLALEEVEAIKNGKCVR